MLIDWLYQTTIETSLLIGLVLLLRPWVRRTLGARVSYWLWFIPLIRAVMIDRPERPSIVFESVGLPNTGVPIYPSAESLTLPSSISWEAVWLTGLIVWLSIRAIGWIRFKRTLRLQSTPLALPDELNAELPENLKRLKAGFYSCDLPGAPFVTGLIVPRIYLPSDFFQQFAPQEQKWVLHHELMHALRKDLWMQLAWELLRGVFWFNPIVHFAAAAVRDDQEIACDQNILKGSSAKDRYDYGRALIAGGGPTLLPTSMAFIGKHKERIAMIKRHRNSPVRNLIGLGLCAMVAAFALTSAPTSLAQNGLDNPVTLKFQEVGLRDIFGMLAEVSGLNIIVSDGVYDGRVTLTVVDTPVGDVLRELVDCAGATMHQGGDNVVLIDPHPDNAPSATCGDIEMLDSGEFGTA